jgi:hypothetical protein
MHWLGLRRGFRHNPSVSGYILKAGDVPAAPRGKRQISVELMQQLKP